MLLPLLVCSVTLVGVCSAADPPRLFHWKGKLAPGLAVEIVGINGDVRAEYSAGSEVEIIAHLPDDAAESKGDVAVTEHANGVTAVSKKPDDVRVNFTVRVPKGVNLIGRTVNGAVEADHLESDVKANTVNGRIRISTTRSAQAHTVNGSITASLNRVSGSFSSAFSTVNGSITLELPKTADTKLSAETTNGEVFSNLGLHAVRKTPKRLWGRLGNGHSALTAKTVNGSIQLRKLANI